VPGLVHEWYGYRASDQTPAAANAAAQQLCPIVGGACTKSGGVCSVQPTTAAALTVTVCPKRLYFNSHDVLRGIADSAFADLGPVLDGSGRPDLVSGDVARNQAAAAGQPVVGVFGQGWGGEIRLPPAHAGAARYSVDFVLVAVTPTGDPARIVPVEVQTIDTTNSYAPSVVALRTGRTIAPSNFGMNWENVNKRILPQLIVKGLMLQGERLCRDGIFFVTSTPVYNKILARLGGTHRFREIPRQPGSITFVCLDHAATAAYGYVDDMIESRPLTVSTSDLSLAFITPENLPPAGSYETLVRRRL
jgi:hypothetical protein